MLKNYLQTLIIIYIIGLSFSSNVTYKLTPETFTESCYNYDYNKALGKYIISPLVYDRSFLKQTFSSVRILYYKVINYRLSQIK